MCVCVCVCACWLACLQAGVPGSDWKDLVTEATAEVLKLGPSPVAVLAQSLLQFSTKMSARWVTPAPCLAPLIQLARRDKP